MKLINTLAMVLAAGSASAAPATSYNQLPPSERALADARDLICGQYPDRDWVLIGTLKVNCKTIKARDDDDVTVDKNWYVEYRVL